MAICGPGRGLIRHSTSVLILDFPVFRTVRQLFIHKPLSDISLQQTKPTHHFIKICSVSPSLNSTGLNFTGPLTCVFLINTTCPLYFVLHQQIQPAVDANFHPSLVESENAKASETEGQLYYIIFCKGLEYPWILVYVGAPGN